MDCNRSAATRQELLDLLTTPVHNHRRIPMGKIASSINDLKVGQRVRHYGCFAPAEGVIVSLDADAYKDDGGLVRLRTGGVTIGLFFNGYESTNRRWEILDDPNAPKPEVGDTVKIADMRVIEGVVRRVETDSDGVVNVAIDGHPFMSFILAADPHPGNETWTTARSWSITKAAPLPWQAGDIIRGRTTGKLLVRQTNGNWMDEKGGVTSVRDHTADDHEPIVRGGRRA